MWYLKCEQFWYVYDTLKIYSSKLGSYNGEFIIGFLLNLDTLTIVLMFEIIYSRADTLSNRAKNRAVNIF